MTWVYLLSVALLLGGELNAVLRARSRPTVAGAPSTGDRPMAVSLRSGHNAGNLHRLSDTSLTVADPAADVRAREVVDSDGEEIGTVEDLLVDDEENKVRFLRVGEGGFLGLGRQHFLVPVDAIASVDPDRVHIDRSRARLADVPVYDPDLAEDPAYYAGLYGWWGYAPHWGAGYVYPPFPYGR
jgi:sporulation protein YlmC with PRC-barrel domain